jgi:class 3 adenylate cyclase
VAINKRIVESLSITASIKLGPPQQAFIFMADLCGSTDFKTYCKTNSIPDGVWIERQLVFLHRIIATVDRFKGVVVKTVGDEVMAYFPRVAPAAEVLRCATDCHTLFGDIQRYDNEIWQIRHKVSVDFGTVYDSNFGLVADGTMDPVGLAVDRCARLNAEAKDDQVVFSSSVFATLEAATQARYAKYREESVLKGAGLSEYYRISIGKVPKESAGA